VNDDSPPERSRADQSRAAQPPREEPPRGDGGADEDSRAVPGSTTIEALLDELDELVDTVDSPAERERVREAIRLARDVEQPTVFGRVVYGFDRSDVAEAALGALVFGIPMAVESGTLEVGAFVAANPPYLLGTLLAAVAIVVGVLYVADIQDVRVKTRYLGLVPRRLVGELLTSYVTAAVLMVLWGRVPLGDPWLAVCQISVAFFPMAIGASLGDILPG
jgi:uncharacterized membrane protein